MCKNGNLADECLSLLGNTLHANPEKSSLQEFDEERLVLLANLLLVDLEKCGSNPKKQSQFHKSGFIKFEQQTRRATEAVVKFHVLVRSYKCRNFLPKLKCSAKLTRHTAI